MRKSFFLKIETFKVKNMLNDKGFDLWADDYDKCVGISDDDGTYPFAGYKTVLNEIFNRVLRASAKTVLDIGFGTGVLTAKLYDYGCIVWGQDFSGRMTELAQRKMPNAKLFRGGFSKGLAEPLTHQKHDAIIATYSLHHMTDAKKLPFIENLLSLLNTGGSIYIADEAFDTRVSLEKCKAESGDEWDDDEMYFVYDALKESLPTMKFEQMSCCAGLLSLQK